MSRLLIRRLLVPALLFPVAAFPQDLSAIYVSKTDICPALRSDRPLIEAMAEWDARALGVAGIEGVAYHCAFEPPLDLTAPDQTITTHTGYCEEAGIITPRLFTFRVEQLETPRATLHDGSDRPMVFFACPF